MALFSNLGERLNHIFSKLTKRGKLTEMEIRTAMREVRVALLEADVNLKVAKQFIAEVSEKAVGQEILSSLNPAQQVIKIVNEELIALMGAKNAKIEVSPKLPTVIMMCGLQGAGKTTLCGKLALLLQKQGKKPMLVAGDIYRPAAINQLQVVGKNVGVEVFEKGTQNPVKTAKEAIEYARSMNYDTVILDTAGRLQIDDTLMQELENIKAQVEVTETLLVVDAMTGQEAVNVADTFNSRLEITGVVLTKLDGDTRGGACLSIKAVTGKPIKFIGVGEKLDQIVYEAIEFWGDLLKQTLEIFQNLWDGIVEKVTGIKDAIVDGVSEAIQFLADLPGKELTWGRDMIDNLINGIKDKVGGIADAIGGIAGTISSYIHFSEPDVGPLKDFHTFMPDMINEMIKGINSGVPRLASAMNGLASSMVPSAQTVAGTTSNSIVLNVYGAQGQNVSELADIIEERITENVMRRGAAFG